MTHLECVFHKQLDQLPHFDIIPLFFLFYVSNCLTNFNFTLDELQTNINVIEKVICVRNKFSRFKKLEVITSKTKQKKKKEKTTE